MGLLGKLDGFFRVLLGGVGKLNGVGIIPFARLGHRLLEVLVRVIVLVRRELLGAELLGFGDLGRDAVDLDRVERTTAAGRGDRYGQFCHRSETSNACSHTLGDAIKRAKTASTAV